MQFKDLNRRGIALALEFGVVTRSPNCAQGIVGEGAGGQELVAVAKRIQKDGGNLKYIAMDEPLYFTGLATLPTSCSLPVSWVAANAASNLLPVGLYSRRYSSEILSLLARPNFRSRKSLHATRPDLTPSGSLSVSRWPSSTRTSTGIRQLSNQT